MSRRRKSPATKARNAFDHDTLKRVCEMHEEEFERTYAMDRFEVEQEKPSNFYLFKDNGADTLAVAHLDTVGPHAQRGCHFLNTSGGEVVYSRALDDRLGAYIILELLPSLGIQHDILLTVGEEDGMSTAQFFNPPKDYNWMIEFDRGGTDVVMYQYDNNHVDGLVQASGAKTADGIFSDICYLEHLGCKGFNWGVGYRDYHGPRAHAYLDDTFMMVGHYLRFHKANAGVMLEHVPSRHGWYSNLSGVWDDTWDSDNWAEVDRYYESPEDDGDPEARPPLGSDSVSILDTGWPYS